MADVHLPLHISEALSIAQRDAIRIKAELEELRRLVGRLRGNVADARRSNKLLKGIVSLLPVGLTVQDEFGRFILINDTAAARLNASPAELTGRFPADAPSPEAQLGQPDAENDLPRGSESTAIEEKVIGPAGERIWLTSRKPVRVLDETLLLSTSLDITERKRIESDLARRAYSDDLTGLANRAMIEEHVENVLRAKGNSEQFRAGVHRSRQFQAHQRLLQPCRRRRASGQVGAASPRSFARPTCSRESAATNSCCWSIRSEATTTSTPLSNVFWRN